MRPVAAANWCRTKVAGLACKLVLTNRAELALLRLLWLLVLLKSLAACCAGGQDCKTKECVCGLDLPMMARFKLVSGAMQGQGARQVCGAGWLWYCVVFECGPGWGTRRK